MTSDETFMARCLQLAELGRGAVEPNPKVGAVVVLENQIIGEGYHEHYGAAHAEVNAIQKVSDKSLLTNATLYVSLEPCSHFGKTPPCTDLIIASKFKRVVIGSVDPNALVNGSGIKKLQDAGIEVKQGVLSDACEQINLPFYVFHQKKRPFVHLKWAQTRNGFIDNAGKQSWISSIENKAMVHQWRSESSAVLVGKNTVLNDNPELTVRSVKGRNPIRIILGGEDLDPSSFRVFNAAAPTWVLNSTKEGTLNNIRYCRLEALDPKGILEFLFQENIQSVLIEGGQNTLKQFLEAGLWDQASVFVADKEFHAGTKAPEINAIPESEQHVHGDLLKQYRNA